MNNRLSNLLPLLLALVFACGMWVQTFLQPQAGREDEQKPLSKLEQVMQLIQEEYVEDIDCDGISEELLPALFEKLDPHSSYISPDEYRDMIDPIRGSFEGIGVQFNIQNDTIVVIQVIPGGPSEKLNIRAGDRIVSVNDSIVAGKGITSEKTVKLLKGPSGTKVKVGIKRHGSNKLISYEITRGAIPITSIDAAYMIDEKTGYISINCFSQTTYDDFLSAVSNLRRQHVENLIIDLRENGGGLLSASIQLANDFLRENDTIVFTKGKNEPAEYYTADGNGTCQDLRLAVLINEYSASASEIFAGAIQDNDRGVVVGRRSYGKGVVNEDFPFPDNSVVRLTTKKFYTPSGRCIQKPYNGKLSDYDHELVERFAHGELYVADSINFPDSLKYTTRSGKIVYGGGGIMPDYFVALDSTNYSRYFQALSDKNILYNLAFSFADENRSTLESMIATEIEDFCSENFSLDIIKQAAKKQQITVTELSAKEADFCKKLFCCYVIRDILGESAFNQAYNVGDETIEKAIELLAR